MLALWLVFSLLHIGVSGEETTSSIITPPVNREIRNICVKLSKPKEIFDLEFVLERSFDVLNIDLEVVADSFLHLASIDGKPSDDLRIEYTPVHLGVGASLYATPGQSEKMIGKMQEEVERHQGQGLYVHTLAHLFHADMLVVKLERKFQECVTLLELGNEKIALECWLEAKSLAIDSRNLINRPIEKSFEKFHKLETLADIPLYYKSINLSQPSFCSRTSEQRTLHIFAKSQNHSVFLHSLGEIYRGLQAKKKGFDQLSDYFNAALVWLMTTWNCANSAIYPAENSYMLLLAKFARARLPSLAERFEDIFAKQIESADQEFQRKTTEYYADAFKMLKLLLGKSDQASGEAEDQTLTEFVENHKREIMENEGLANLWLATDGSYHRTELMNIYLNLAGFYQCLIMDAAQANLYEVGSIVANGAMWCSTDPASLIFSETHEEPVLVSTSVPISFKEAQDLFKAAKNV